MQSQLAQQEYKETELGLLPKEWEVVKLGDAVNTTKGRRPKNLKETFEINVLPYLTADYFRTKKPSLFTEIQDKSVVKINEDDIVFIWDGSNAGEVFTGLKGVLASTMVLINPINTKLAKNMLYYFLKTKFDMFNTTTTGSTIPHINKSIYENLLIPLPSLSEQDKIASVLSTIQEAVEQTEKVINSLKELKKSMMKHLFTYGPISLEDAEKVELKETEIGKMPKEWDVVKLGDVVNIIYGVQAAVAHLNDSTKGIPILTNINVNNNGFLDLSVLRYYNLPERKKERLLLKKGDILFNWRSGSKAQVGKTAIFNLEGEYTFSSFILRFRANGNIDNLYLYYNLRYLKDLNFFGTQGNVSSVNAVFNASYSSNIPIYLPDNQVQQKIATILSSLDKKIGAEENQKKSFEELFKTMLQNLMMAKIRVN
jgi:type I restriction enzyme, S subunit